MNDIIVCNAEHPIFCTIDPQTDEEKAMVYNMANSMSGKLSDMINKVINLRAVYVELTDGVNSDTGEAWRAPRCVLLDDNGKTYTATSNGLFRALQKLLAIYGPGPWDKPLAVEVKQVDTSTGRRIYTLQKV